MTNIKLQLEKQLDDSIKKDLLPEDVSIDTMTIICNTNIIFNVANIAKYIDLEPTAIIDIKYGRTKDNMANRTLIPCKRSKKKKITKKIFFNQVSIKIMIEDKKNRPVNIKLFSNGSMQLTGCKVASNALDTIEKIFDKLKKVKAIVNPITMKVEDKPFCNDSKLLILEKITNIYVAMIVSKFTFPVKINRTNLHKILIKDDYEVSYNPESHSSVDIKYKYNKDKTSIFVFEKGPIVITGVKTCAQILHAYKFINTYLLTYHKEISKRNLGQNDIEKFLNPETENESDVHMDFCNNILIKNNIKTIQPINTTN